MVLFIILHEPTSSNGNHNMTCIVSAWFLTKQRLIYIEGHEFWNQSIVPKCNAFHELTSTEYRCCFWEACTWPLITPRVLSYVWLRTRLLSSLFSPFLINVEALSVLKNSYIAEIFTTAIFWKRKNIQWLLKSQVIFYKRVLRKANSSWMIVEL